MCVIFFLLANISIINKGLPVVFCKGFSCVLRMTYIITRQIRSPIHSVSFSHRAHVCKTRGEVILSRRTFFSLTLGSFFSHREHGGHGGFKRTYSFVESFFSHRAHRFNRTFWRTFRAHRTPPAYRVHRAFQLLSLLKRDITKPTSFL